MQRELFGVFGDRTTFDRLNGSARFDTVVATDGATVGVRDPSLGSRNRTSVHAGDAGTCVVWGEAIEGSGASAAERLLERVGEVGNDAFGELNGSYLAFVDRGDGARLVTDPVRSWECYYTDAPGVRVFGSDAARVARTIDDPEFDRRALSEFVHFGITFGDRTPFEALERVPFDGYLAADDAGSCRRFVYDPQPPEEFDYVAELADRFERAVKRRTDLPGRDGLLLSAGYDSRVLLSVHRELDVGYTLGSPSADEVRVSKQIATQYGLDHETLRVTEDYLDLRPEVIQYTNGHRESLHIHHRGNDDEIAVDNVFHGMLFDTLFRGYFLPGRSLDLLGRSLPLDGLDPDPDVPLHLAKKFGGLGSGAYPSPGPISAASAAKFARETIGGAYERSFDRTEDPYNAIDLVGVRQKPTLPFRTHLADNYVESFVAADAELLDWHLKTPPERRNLRTFLAALERIDRDVLYHDPPDRPHRSYRLNEIESFLRSKLPGLETFGSPWPDRDTLYARRELDRRLFADHEEVHGLPTRVKLRLYDLQTWIGTATESAVGADELLGVLVGELPMRRGERSRA
jgi:asparagine synthetase B (glutamine-hydrolysing)